MKSMIRFFVVMLCLLPSLASAGSRDAHKMGIFGGVVSSPFPSVYGANVAYNFLPFMRGSVGVGFISASDGVSTLDAKTLNAELKLLVSNWNFSPMLAFGASYVTMTITGEGNYSQLGGLSGSGIGTYIGGGFDWQTGYGFNIGLEYKQLLVSGGTGLPGVYLGWYF